MVQLNLSFRKLLLQNVRDLKSAELNRYESLLALRLDLVHRLGIFDNLPNNQDDDCENGQEDEKVQERQTGGAVAEQTGSPVRPIRELPSGSPLPLIRQATGAANEIIQPFRGRFEALHAIWMSRRQLAVDQGNLLQIPTSTTGLINLLRSIVNYRVGQLSNFGVVLAGRIEDFYNALWEGRRLVLYTAIALAILIGVVLFLTMVGDKAGLTQ